MTNLSKGQIITFYSYKGGPGRSMTLANVAWILASNGKRVLVVDWDLEAPGIHRYFAPFLGDKELTSSRGVIDFVWDFVVEAMTPSEETEKDDGKWYEPLANILRYAVPLKWNFPEGGTLDFVPAGRQGPSYAKRVNSFNWQNFYERFGGGVFLEAVKETMREEYDYILVDSRTGVSDTSGICTVQMPDILAVFFTANNQSIEGAVAVAESVEKQWEKDKKQSGHKRLIFPILARTERAELDKLNLARDYAKAKFAPFLHHIPEMEQEDYWGRAEIPYVPWYAFEEVLATFGDEPKKIDSLLAATERLTNYLTQGEVRELVPPSEEEREKVLLQFIREDFIRSRVSLAKLPSTSPDLFGREKELGMLDAAWGNPQTNIVSLVAWGGVGKTALVNKWLMQMGKDNYRGAEQVYGWSFYSQGAAEGRQTSADLFITSVLRWFGDPNPDEGSPWSKGERLGELIKKQWTLLILDGLEPLQYPPGEMEGRLKDSGLQVLLRELAHHNPGLCIITTRLPVDDLKDFVGSSVECVNLEHLSSEAGAVLLENFGVKGTADELKQAVDEFDGHALALTLLGRYLAAVYNGDIRQRDKIASLTKGPQQGGHARRAMESYERWFEGKPELNILHIMGLFDHPAEGGAIDALKAEPAIEGLTSELQELSYEDWQFALNNLRTAGLLAERDPNAPDTLDCHPLIREHFGEKLKESNPDAWKEAHSRLYEFYKSQAKEFPDTIEEMAPLYAAVAHGCQAARYQEALEQVYQQRILRGDIFYSTYTLGAFGAELSAMSGFFEPPWEKPVDGLTGSAKAFVMRQTGYCFRALGRLEEATKWIQEALKAHIAQGSLKDAAIDAAILNHLYLYMGDLTKALEYAKQGVDLAERSGNTLYRVALRGALVETLHRAGRMKEAVSTFPKVEEMQQAKEDTEYPVAYANAAFRYCTLLLDQGKYPEMQERAESALETVKPASRSLLAIAVSHLSLGRAYLMQAQKNGKDDDFSQTAEHLNDAVKYLRMSGRQGALPQGFVARAELYRVRGEFEQARGDLEEAMFIATRIGMGLHQADCHLEYTRLYLAMGEKDKARDSLATAKEMIEEMGYHRRTPEIHLEYARLYLATGEKDKARESLASAKREVEEKGLHRWDRDVQELEEQIGGNS